MLNFIQKKKNLSRNFGKQKLYDHLIVATHADQVNEFLLNKNKGKNFFTKYTKNSVYLHSDQSLMPKIKKLLVKLNYRHSKALISQWHTDEQTTKHSNKANILYH